ncbi:MAG: glycosyltransferase [Bacillota bacterium]
MTPSITLAMIVRNEEAKLARCLESVRGAVDEIVIVDTGSSDRTLEIAGKYTDKVYSCSWTGDFSAARNYSLDRAESQWILCLDADEELDMSHGDLRTLVKNCNGPEAFFLPLHNKIDETPGSYNRYLVLRLFKKSSDYRFRGKIHEQITVKHPEAVAIAEAPVIWHRSTSNRERNRKRGRNLALLRQALEEDPHNPFLHYYLGLEWMGLNRPERALPHFRRSYRGLAGQNNLFTALAILCLISCLRITGEVDKALCICIEEAIRHPQYTDLFFEGGILFEQKGEYRIAAKWFQEAINCGTPPAPYNHMNGTGSFLSLYHLGYCREKSGLIPEAVEYYNRALESNPGYIYPVYNLFSLFTVVLGPRRAFDRLQEDGHLNHPGRAAALAHLFFEAGYPDLAAACIPWEWINRPDTGNPFGPVPKILIYGGRTEEGLSCLEKLRQAGGETDPDTSFDEIASLILKEDYRAARIKSLALRRVPEAKDLAVLALNLVSVASGGGICIRPGAAAEKPVLQKALFMLECCWRYRPHPAGAHRPYLRLAENIISLLTRLSPATRSALYNYIKEKENRIRKMAESKFGPAGGLYQ